MDSRDLRVNQRVEIEVDMTAYKGVYPSRVEEVDEKGVYLAIPIKHGAFIPLRVGEPVRVYFLKDEQVYCLRSEILNRKQGPVPQILVAHSRNIVRVQRRNWVRLEIGLPVTLYHSDGNQERVERGRTVNISGGGALFVTRADWLKVGDSICVRLELPEREPFVSPAVVRRIDPPEAGGSKGYRVACEFVDIREAQRDALVKFIFEVQRERIKKGLA